MGLECGPKSDAKSFKMREAEHGWQIQNGDSLTPLLPDPGSKYMSPDSSANKSKA